LDYYRKAGNQMGMSSDELQETCEWMAEEGADEVRGLEIPIDKKGAKYMYTINPHERRFPVGSEEEAMRIILKKAGF
jgi:hypothetical protein